MGACSSKKVVTQVAPGAIFNKNEKGLSGGRSVSTDEHDLLSMSNKPSRDGVERQIDNTPVFEKDGNRTHEELWQAIERNDLKAAEKFLDAHEIEEQDMYDSVGQSMLHKVAQLDYSDMLMLIVERTGAKTDIVNAQLATPLHVACQHNSQSVVKFLISCGVDANVQDEHGQTPLLICCTKRNKELISILLESSIAGHLPEPIEADVRDHRGLTPLNCAATNGYLEIVKLLVSRGEADVNQPFTKGLAPLTRAALGGSTEVVRYLLEKGANPLKQDSSGATALHHAVQNGHLGVLEVMVEQGVDVYSVIELADNLGRTPLFEAVEKEGNSKTIIPAEQIIRVLTKSRSDGGYGAKVDVLNYNGQTPLFHAARSRNFAVVKALIDMGASVDLNSGELVSKESQIQENDDTGDEQDSIFDQCFRDALMNCMTPLHVAAALGDDQIALLLVNSGADVNLQTKYKRYTALHIAVLSNKPEMLIELLTKSAADPLLEDYKGRTLLDMIYEYNPSYVDSFQSLLETLQLTAPAKADLAGAASESAADSTANANAGDDRMIQGVDADQIRSLYEQEESKARNNGGLKRDQEKNGMPWVDDGDIEIEEGSVPPEKVESCFGRKFAVMLVATDWKIKEQAVKFICQCLEMLLAEADEETNMAPVVMACMAAVGSTCREKVMKVFNASLHMLNLMISSSKIEASKEAMSIFRGQLLEENIVPRLLLKSEESNTRLTNKIHETLLDLSYHSKIGEDLVSQAILIRIDDHQKGNRSNHKGLLAQLALLYKMINSFGVKPIDLTCPMTVQNSDQQLSNYSGSLTVSEVLMASMASVDHSNADVRNAAVKIVLDVQRLTGKVKEHHYSIIFDQKAKDSIREKVAGVSLQLEMNQSVHLPDGILAASGKLMANRGGAGQETTTTSASGSHQSPGKHMTDEQKALAVLLASEDAEESNKESSLTRSSVGGKTSVPGLAGANALSDNVQVRDKFYQNKAIVIEKGEHKEWQQREQALTAMHACFENCPLRIIRENQTFLKTCCRILYNCLEENNIQIYLVGVQTAAVFLSKALHQKQVLARLPGLLRAVVLRTQDTNTRVRKKSIDLINQVWGSNSSSAAIGAGVGKKNRDQDSISFIIATVLCDQQLADKAIVGRLSLFIKKAMLIESGEELNKRAFKIVIGKDYEEISGFACQWCMHKNTKVRQCALKLIVEVCRLNHIDPRGQPFKARILSYILGLRQSLRAPLVTKINQVCAEELVVGQDTADKKTEPYINVSEMELSVATKGRAASMDVRQAPREKNNIDLPQIRSSGVGLPGLVGKINVPNQKPQLVLPHSEPLTESQKAQAEPFMEVFGQEIMTCFYSQTWSTRAAAIEKIVEQLHNLDPRYRDAMYGEINRSNQPPEITVRVFFQLVSEGFKDPNLKNYLNLLELVQKGLSIYFKHLATDQIQSEIEPLVKNTISKTSDLKVKVREASINFCLYLSHQSQIGAEFILSQVICEIRQALLPQRPGTTHSRSSTSGSQANFGSSHLLASCLTLMSQLQQQAELIKQADGELFSSYVECINRSLQHTNPTVRKQAESLFKVLYAAFGPIMLEKIASQKPQLVQKLTQEAQQEAAAMEKSNNQSSQPDQPQTQHPSVLSSTSQRQPMSISENLASMPKIKQLFAKETAEDMECEELFKELQAPNAKKRLKVIVAIKKIVQRKMAKSTSNQARDMVEPLQALLRELLKDENTEVYLEALNLLKFIVGSLSSHLSSLDMHLMIGQFISLTVTNASTANMRIRVASDKVIIYFAKHTGIGSLIVAREVLKNIESTNRALQSKPPTRMPIEDVVSERTSRKEILVRHFSILQMLLSQFSIVLCYQPEFYVKCLEHVATTMIMCAKEDEPAIKSICQQIIINLYQIDCELLDKGVNKLDFTKKTPLRKIMIEHENLAQRHKSLQINGLVPAAPQLVANRQLDSPMQSMRDTQQSFASFATLDQQPTTPSSMRMRMNGTCQSIATGTHRDFGQTDTGTSWNNVRQRSEVRQSRDSATVVSSPFIGRNGLNRQESMTSTQMQGGWSSRRATNKMQEESGSGLLPDIGSHRRGKLPIGESMQSMGRMTGAAGFKRDGPDPGLPGFTFNDPNATSTDLQIGGIATGGITQNSTISIQRTTDSQVSGSPLKSARRSYTQRMAALAAQQDVKLASATDKEKDNRPPLYVPTKREPGAANPRMLSNLATKEPPNGSTSGQAAASQTSTYQPKTSFSYVPSAELAAAAQKAAKPPLLLSNLQTTPRAVAAVAAAASYNPTASPMLAGIADRTKPPKPLKLSANLPPPVATFQTKTFDYEQPSKGKPSGAPDISSL